MASSGTSVTACNRGKATSLPMTAAVWSRRLAVAGRRSMRAGQHGLDRVGHGGGRRVGALFHHRAGQLLEKEGIPLRFRQQLRHQRGAVHRRREDRLYYPQTVLRTSRAGGPPGSHTTCRSRPADTRAGRSPGPGAPRRPYARPAPSGTRRTRRRSSAGLRSRE